MIYEKFLWKYTIDTSIIYILLTVLMLIPHCKSLQRSLHALNKRAFKLLVLLVTLVSITDVRRLHIIPLI